MHIQNTEDAPTVPWEVEVSKKHKPKPVDMIAFSGRTLFTVRGCRNARIASWPAASDDEFFGGRRRILVQTLRLLALEWTGKAWTEFLGTAPIARSSMAASWRGNDSGWISR